MSARRKWTDEEVAYICSSYGEVPVKDICKKLKTNQRSLYKVLEQNEIPRLRTEIRWTEADVEYLKERYHNSANQDLAEYIGCSTGAVFEKAKSLGLKKAEGYDVSGLDKRIDQIRQVLIQSPRAYTISEVAKAFGLSYQMASKYIRLGKMTDLVKTSTSLGAEKLFDILREIFPKSKIHLEYHVGERLRLDLFVENNFTGWEFDGKQHYQRVAHFDKSDDALEERQARDKRKEELCQARGINLIRIRYDDPLTVEFVVSKFNEAGAGSGEWTEEAVLTTKEKSKAYRDRMRELKKEFSGEHLKNIQRTETEQETKSKDSFKAAARVRRRERYRELKAQRDNSQYGRDLKERRREWGRERRRRLSEWKKKLQSE